MEVSTRELKEQVLSPNESSVSIVRIARQARSEKSKKLFQIFSRQGANETLVASMARLEEHLGMLVVLERECLALREEVEHWSEKQEVLATLMEGKMSMQRVALKKYPGEDLRGVEGVGGAEDKRSIGSCTMQAQVGKMRRRKGTSQDVARDGAVRNRRSFPELWTIPPLLILPGS